MGAEVIHPHQGEVSVKAAAIHCEQDARTHAIRSILLFPAHPSNLPSSPPSRSASPAFASQYLEPPMKSTGGISSSSSSSRLSFLGTASDRSDSASPRMGMFGSNLKGSAGGMNKSFGKLFTRSTATTGSDENSISESTRSGSRPPTFDFGKLAIGRKGGSGVLAGSHLSASNASVGGEGSLGVIRVEPPSSFGRREPSTFALALAKKVEAAFGIDNSVDSILREGLSVDNIIADLRLHSALTELNLSQLRPTDFPSPEAYDRWRIVEKCALEDLLSSTAGAARASLSPMDENHRSSILITLNVIQAKGLMPKDKASGSANPYAVIYTPSGMVFQSCVVVGDLNPSFSLSVTFPIKDLAETTFVALWNRTSPSGSVNSSNGNGASFVLGTASSDAFLGMVTLSHSELASSCSSGVSGGGSGSGERVECWKTLEKRSPKSNVTGSLLVSFEPTIKSHHTTQDLYATAFRTVPPDPVPSFYSLLSKLIEHDRSMARGPRGDNKHTQILSSASVDVMEYVCASWRIHHMLPVVILFDIFTDLYSVNAIDAETLYSEGFLEAADNIEKALTDAVPVPNVVISIFRTTCSTLYSLLSHQISTFFDQPASILFLPSASSSTNFRHQTLMIEHLVSHPFSTGIPSPDCPLSSETERLVGVSFAGRYHGVCALARARILKTGREVGGAMTPVVLEEIVMGLAGELKGINASFDELYFGKVHVPTIATSVFLDNLLPQIEGFSRTYAAGSHVLEEVIALYRAVQVLEGVCETIDYRFLQLFKVCEWFRPFMKDWLRVSETKIGQWVQNAIQLDNFSQQVELGTSSSVLDIFTSFQQQVDFLIKLRWPDPIEEGHFSDRLLQNICEGIERYVVSMRHLISRDITNHTTSKPLQQTSASASTLSSSSSSSRKFRMKLPGVRRAGPPVDPSELRILAITCVKLVNLDSLVDRLREITERIPVRKTLSSDSGVEAMMKGQPPPPPPKLDDSIVGDGRSLPPLPPRRRDGAVTSPTMASDAPRMPARITVVAAHSLSSVRPFTTLVSVRVSSVLSPVTADTTLSSSSPTGPIPSTTHREILRTPFKPQRPTITWDPHPIPVIVTSREIERGLDVSLVQAVPGMKGEYVVAMGNVGVGDSDVPLGGGRVRLRIEADWEGTLRIVLGRVGYVVEAGLEEGVDAMVEKIFSDLRVHLKDLSAKYKKSEIMKSKLVQMSKNPMSLFTKATPSTTLSATTSSQSLSSPSPLNMNIVHTEISPLLDHLDVNLGVASETMPDWLTRRLVARMWGKILAVCMSLLLPPLGEGEGVEGEGGGELRSIGVAGGLGSKEKRVWDEMRVGFLRWTVEILKSFLHSDGDGLPIEFLETHAYTSLISTFDHYDLPKKDAIALHQRSFGIGDGSRDMDDAWLLRLIRLKKGNEYVEGVLYARATGMRM
ncbi:hypothetical protein HDU67_001402 [Dinochytrium kinnereticum]|nr:hypothetical protein HDU67_001402 [Dinochytrium kinnereticum]